MKKKGPRVNLYIEANAVRLIGSDGEMVGIVAVKQALLQAKNEKLDLVEVNPNADPPVCKILDYGRMRYDIQKKQHKARKSQNVIVVKEIKMRPNIGEHDYLIKIRNIKNFLEDKCKVKISLRFRGREIVHKDIGMNILNRIVEDTKELANLESKPEKTGNQFVMLLAAK